MSWAIPAIAGGVSATATMRGARSDANALTEQAGVVQRQANRDEEAQRREARQILGKQVAAMAQAGGGMDEGLLRQSAINAELDALNIRYAGSMKATGLLAQAKSIKKQSKLLAGAQLLSGISQSYTYKKAAA